MRKIVAQMKIARIIIYYLSLFIIFSFKTETDKLSPYKKLKLEQNVSKDKQRDALYIVHDYNSSRSNK